MKKIIHPPFLQRFDHYLRANHPVVWRARAHWVVYYALGLVMPALVLMSCLIPVKVGVDLGGDSLAGMSGILYLLAVLSLLRWLYTQTQIKLKNRSWRAVGISFGLSLLILCSIRVASLSVNLPVYYRLALLRTEAELAADFEAVEPIARALDFGDFYSVDVQAIEREHKERGAFSFSQTQAQAIVATAEEYGYEDINIELQDIDGEKILLALEEGYCNHESRPCEGTILFASIYQEEKNDAGDMIRYYMGHDLRAQIQDIQDAQSFWQGKGSLFARHFRHWQDELTLFVLLWLVATVLGTSKQTLGPEAWNFKRLMGLKSVGLQFPTWANLDRWDRHLLTEKPARWSMSWAGMLVLVGGAILLGLGVIWAISFRDGAGLLHFESWQHQDRILSKIWGYGGLALIGTGLWWLTKRPFPQSTSAWTQFGFLSRIALLFGLFFGCILVASSLMDWQIARLRSGEALAADRAFMANHVFIQYTEEENVEIANPNIETWLPEGKDIFLFAAEGSFQEAYWHELGEAYGFDRVQIEAVPWSEAPFGGWLSQTKRAETRARYIYSPPAQPAFRQVLEIREYDANLSRWIPKAYPATTSFPHEVYRIQFVDDNQSDWNTLSVDLFEQVMDEVEQAQGADNVDLKGLTRNPGRWLDKSLTLSGLMWLGLMQILLLFWAIRSMGWSSVLGGIVGILLLGFCLVLIGLATLSAPLVIWVIGPLWMIYYVGATYHFSTESVERNSFNRTIFLINFLLSPIMTLIVGGYLIVILEETLESRPSGLFMACVPICLGFFSWVCYHHLKGLQRMWYMPKEK